MELEMKYTLTALVVAICVFVLTVLIERKLIPILSSHKVGQKILEIGPRWHKGKEGTPIMGGLAFVASSLIVMAVVFVLALVNSENRMLIPLAFTYGLAVLNGAIGYLDDYTKLVKKQNQGFKEWQKLVLQIIIAVAYTLAMAKMGYLGTDLVIPFVDYTVDLGVFYYIIVIVFIIGMANSSNFTDGIDGLLSTVSAVISIFLIVMSIMLRNEGALLISASLLGGTLGFLVYNFHPARVFMGDTGSLFIGAAIAGAAIMTEQLIVVLIASIIFVIETASVILQRASYKLRGGKRIFKMAPIHHHFEMCKWSEYRIVAVFSLVTLVFCILAFFGI